MMRRRNEREPETSRPLTGKAIRFAELIATGAATSHAEAYRIAYDRPDIRSNTASVNACRLLEDPRIKQMLDEVRTRAATSMSMSHDVLCKKLWEIAEQAAEENPGAAVSALLGIARIKGYLSRRDDDVPPALRGRWVFEIKGLPTIEHEQPIEDAVVVERVAPNVRA